MSKLNAATFAKFCLERAALKDGYIMGSIGQDPSKWSRGSWYFSQYSGAQKTKALYWREHARRVWDCQGLVEGYINDQLGTSINVYARTNFANWCNPKGSGKIPVAQRVPGAAVFHHNGSRVTHVGYLVEPVAQGVPEGDWWVVEAKGVMYGVVKTKLSKGSWNRWGLMTKYFEYEDDPISFEFGARVLSLGCTGDDVREMQSVLIELGYSCGTWGADGDFGEATRKALLSFQSDNDLAQDGEMNQDDFDALREALVDEEPPEEIDPEPEVSAPEATGKKIVDLSKWNGKIADADAMAKDVRFVIHRASFGLERDSLLEYNMKKLKMAKIPFGVYHYLKALTVDDAKAEARAFYAAAAPHMPIFWALDCEYGKITAKTKKNEDFARGIVASFLDEMETLGVPMGRVGVYIGHHLYKLWGLAYDRFAFVWIPRYGSNDGTKQKKPDYPCDLWQFTSRGKVNGIADKTLDLNAIVGSGKTDAWFCGEE